MNGRSIPSPEPIAVRALAPLSIAMLGTRGMPTTFGGVERSVEEISVRLAARGHNVTVYCRTPYVSNRPDEFNGVRLRYLPAINTKHLEAASHTALATADAIARRFDVVHFHATGPALFSPFAHLSRAAVVVTVQGLDFQRAKWGGIARGVLKLAAWLTARTPDATVVVSSQLEKYYEEHYGRRVYVIPNGVALPTRDVSAIAPPFGLQADRYFLSLGRLVPEKGIHDLIQAYAAVSTDVPLVIAGPSSHSDDYVRRLHALAAADRRVQFVGGVYGQEKDALVGHALAYCSPSYLEGLPLTLLEVLAHGRLAIVSDLPEHLEVVDQGAVGWTTPVGDVTALAHALQRVADQPDVAADVRRSAIERVAGSFDWDIIVDQLEGVYRDVSVQSVGSS